MSPAWLEPAELSCVCAAICGPFARNRLVACDALLQALATLYAQPGG